MGLSPRAMRNILIADAAVILIATGVWVTSNLTAPANSHVLVFPDGHRGLVVLRTNVDEGVVLDSVKRVYTLEFSDSGILELQGLLPKADWQNVSAKFRSGGLLEVVWPGKRADDDLIALRDVGSSPDDTEYLFVIGTKDDARRAMQAVRKAPEPRRSDPKKK